MGSRRSKSAAAVAAAAVTAALKDQTDDDDVVPLDPEQDDAEAAALESLKALGEGGDTRYVVTCLAPLSNKGKCDEVTADDIPELWQYLRDKHGPGRYAVHAVTRGVYVKGSRTIIEISTLAVKGNPSTTAAAALPAGSSDLERWMAREETRAEQRRQEQREDQKFMLQLFATLQGNRSGESLSGLVGALVQLKALESGAAGALTPEKMIELLTKGMELGGKGGGGNEHWLSVVRETLKDLSNSQLGQSVMDRIANRQPANGAPAGAAPRIAYVPPNAAPPSPGPAAGTTAPTATNCGAAAPAATGDAVFDALLNKLADELVEYAANGCDPGLAAEALVAKVPRTVRAFVTAEQLKGWLTLPDWWAKVVAFRPALQPYMAFCDDVRQALYAQLVEAPPEGGETVQ